MIPSDTCVSRPVTQSVLVALSAHAYNARHSLRAEQMAYQSLTVERRLQGQDPAGTFGIQMFTMDTLQFQKGCAINDTKRCLRIGVEYVA